MPETMTIRLGSIAGVRISANISALVIVAIIVIALAVGRFPAAYPQLSPVLHVLAAAVVALLFFGSLLAHEVAHALVARRNGMQVSGIVLWLFGGVAELEGDTPSPGADFRIAVIGPVVSLLAGGMFGGLAAALMALGHRGIGFGMFGYLAAANVLIGLFNLIPAAPLDGGRVLRAALWAGRKDRIWAAVTAARVGRVFGVLVMALGVVELIVGMGFGGLWLMLIGFFLVSAATAEERQNRLHRSVTGLRVGDVMSEHPVTAEPQQSVQDFIAELAWVRPHSTYPLIDEHGRLTGLVTLSRVRSTPPDQRADSTLLDIACRPDEVPIAGPDDALVDLLPRMHGCADGRAVVVGDGSRLIGIVSPSDISRVMQVRDLRGYDPTRPTMTA